MNLYIAETLVSCPSGPEEGSSSVFPLWGHICTVRKKKTRQSVIYSYSVIFGSYENV